MFCRSCGFNLGEENGFCPGCGAPIEEQVSKLVTFPNDTNGLNDQKHQLWDAAVKLELKNDKSNAVVGILGIFALLSLAVGTSLLVMSLITALESKKKVELADSYFENEDFDMVREDHKKIIELSGKDSSI